jgi:hypothetical protein
LLGLTLCTWLLVTTATARAERIFIPAAANNPYTGILFADDFSDPTSGWQMGEDDYVRNGYVEGEYEILLKRDGSLLSFYYPHTFTDYSYQVDARLLPSNASRAYGIVFGLINLKNYVAFIVDNQQLFAVHRLTDNQWTVLHDWQPLPFALGDLAAANRFRVDHSGDSYVIYINDQEVVRGTDPQLLRPHGMGVALTITNFTPNESITVRYDNLEVRALLE